MAKFLKIWNILEIKNLKFTLKNLNTKNVKNNQNLDN